METRTGSHHEQSRNASRNALLTNPEHLEELAAPAAKKSRQWAKGLCLDQSASLNAQPDVPDHIIKGQCDFPMKAPSVLKQALKEWGVSF